MMVDAAPGMPGDAGTFPAYRGDPWERVFQFVDQDTTDWDVAAQARRYADSTTIAATFTVETAYQSDIELVRVSLDEDASKLLPPAPLACDFEVATGTGIANPPRTMLAWILDVDPDVTRVEGS